MCFILTPHQSHLSRFKRSFKDTRAKMGGGGGWVVKATATLSPCCARTGALSCQMSEISTCYSGPMLRCAVANSSHMQPIFCLCDPRCLDMVSLPEIKAAFDNGCGGGGERSNVAGLNQIEITAICFMSRCFPPLDLTARTGSASLAGARW